MPGPVGLGFNLDIVMLGSLDVGKASARSSSVTSSTWSKRASALRTCSASVRGSLRCFGKAKALSGSSFRSSLSSSPCCLYGFQVVLTAMVRTSIYPLRGRVMECCCVTPLAPLSRPAPAKQPGRQCHQQKRETAIHGHHLTSVKRGASTSTLGVLIG